MTSKCEDDKIYICSLCSESFKSTDELKTHLNNHNGSPELQLTCEVCHKPFATTQDLRRHQQISLGFMSFKCFLCNRVFFNKNTWKCHMVSHTQKHVCSFIDCGIHANKKAISVEQDITNTDEIPTTNLKNCSTCNMRFTAHSDSPNINYNDPINRGSNQCANCLKYSPINSLLKKKELVKKFEQIKVIPLCSSKENETFICCGEIFNKPDAYVKHQNWYHKKEIQLATSKPKIQQVKPLAVGIIAGSSLKENSTTKNPYYHMKPINEYHKAKKEELRSKPFKPRKSPLIIRPTTEVNVVKSQVRHLKCVKCQKMFSSALQFETSGLRAKQFLCRSCIVSSISLQEHICSICDATFNNSVSLKTHQKMHENYRNQKPPVPQKAFPIVHYRPIRRGPLLRQCFICAENFETSVELVNHYASHSIRPDKTNTNKSFYFVQKEGDENMENDKKNNDSNSLQPLKEYEKIKFGNLSQKESSQTEIMFYDAVCQSPIDTTGTLPSDKNEIETILSPNIIQECDNSEIMTPEKFAEIIEDSAITPVEKNSKIIRIKAIVPAEKSSKIVQEDTIKPAAKIAKIEKFSSELKSFENNDSSSLSNQLIFSCKYCDKPCTNLASLNKHVKAHMKKSATIKEMTKIKHPTHLNGTIFKQTYSKPFQCLFCPKSFTVMTCFDKHLEKHKRPKAYQCYICAQAFDDTHELVSHLLTHNPASTSKNVLKEQLENQSSNVVKHFSRYDRSAVPNRLAPVYQCYVCAKYFGNSKKLVEHSESHKSQHLPKDSSKLVISKQEDVTKSLNGFPMNKIPDFYQCYVCAMYFNSSSNLVKHLASHKVENGAAGKVPDSTTSKKVEESQTSPQLSSGLESEICFFDAACQNVEPQNEPMLEDQATLLEESVNESFPVQLIKEENNEETIISGCGEILPDFETKVYENIKIEEDDSIPTPTESLLLESNVNVINIPESLQVCKLASSNGIPLQDSPIAFVN